MWLPTPRIVAPHSDPKSAPCWAFFCARKLDAISRGRLQPGPILTEAEPPTTGSTEAQWFAELDWPWAWQWRLPRGVWMRSFKHLFNNPLLMLSFSTPPFHLENSAASVAAAASHYLHIWNESDGAAETSASEDSWVSCFTSVLIWFFPLFTSISTAI